MTASQLIAELKNLPQNAEVFHLYDGFICDEVERIWCTDDGRIITANSVQSIYEDQDQPSKIT